jgi:AhpD family alkylhydroperoxidase
MAANGPATIQEQTMYDVDNLKKLPTLGSHAQTAWDAFKNFDQAALAEGAIPKKYKELMAVAVALTTQCPYCIEIHSRAARKVGATEEELAETAFVAAAIRAGGAITHATHFVDQP